MDTNESDRTGVGELSAILAHEIKNPMNSIIINIEVLRSSVVELTEGKDTTASSRAKKYLDVIEGEIRRLDKVIKGFLDFASPPQSTKIKINLNAIAQSLSDLMVNEMKQKLIKMELELNETPPQLLGSSDQIKQALLNLVINAMQALPNGGTIRIKTLSTEKTVGVSVQDNGSGIDEKLLDKIFNPYFTTKAKGSGLGLSVVRRVIREHGGEVKIETEIGKGSTFTLLFPKLTELSK